MATMMSSETVRLTEGLARGGGPESKGAGGPTGAPPPSLRRGRAAVRGAPRPWQMGVS